MHTKFTMKSIIAAAGLFVLTGASAAWSDAIDERAKDLLPWVAQKTGYRADYIKVTVLFVEPKQINLIAYGAKFKAQTDVEAVSAGATIFLPTWFRLGENDDILVHELTHVLQFQNDASFRCRAEQEKEAYETQAAFTDETGIGTKPHPFAMFLLRCPSKSAPH